MTFAGVDSHDGLSADFDSDLSHGDTPFQLFTFRNLINFLLGFSWTGISFYGTIDSKVHIDRIVAYCWRRLRCCILRYHESDTKACRRQFL